MRAIIWVANLHDDLLLGRNHRAVNGIASIDGPVESLMAAGVAQLVRDQQMP